MAKKVEDTLFLVIEGKGSEFLAIGLGGGNMEDHGTITSGIFEGFTHIVVGGGVEMICDHCNEDIKEDETCYYVAVFNYILCKDCFDNWLETATYYPEDAAIERRNYEYYAGLLNEKGLLNN